MNLGGWIKLHRKVLDNPIVCKDAETFAIWMYMLLMAAHEGTDVVFKGKRQHLEPGQFLSSIRQISAKLKVDRTKTYRAIKLLKSESQIETQESNKNTLFTIKNWAKYQTGETQNETQVRHKRDTSETQNKNDKNDNKYIYIESNDSIRQTDAVRHVLEKWNAQSDGSGIPSVSRLSPGSTRYKMLLARIKEYGIENVVKAISKIGESSFLRGQNRQGWMITFDWFVKPSNFVKVLEGNYSDKSGAQQQRGVDTW